MNIKFYIIFLYLFSFATKGNTSNDPLTRDSLQQLFISFGQKKIQAQMNQNQKFIQQGLLDSLNYVIKLDSRSLFLEGGLSAEFIQEYIPDGLTEANKPESIITNASLADYNKQLSDINASRSIKTDISHS